MNGLPYRSQYATTTSLKSQTTDILSQNSKDARFIEHSMLISQKNPKLLSIFGHKYTLLVLSVAFAVITMLLVLPFAQSAIADTTSHLQTKIGETRKTRSSTSSLASQSPSSPNSPSITTLSAKLAATAIIDESLEPYISLLTAREIAAKTNEPIATDLFKPENRTALLDLTRKRYQAAVRDFSDEEKELLTTVITQMHSPLQKLYPLLAKTSWSIIKKSDTLEGGAHFTLGKHIILSEGFLKRALFLTKERKHNKTDSQEEQDKHAAQQKRNKQRAAAMVMGLLLHEQAHVLQRLHPTLFKDLYENTWHFKHVDKIQTTPWMTERQLLNPDAVDVRWIFPIAIDANKTADSKERSNEKNRVKQVRYIWPQILLEGPRDKPRMFRDAQFVAIDLVKENKHWAIKQTSDEDSTPARSPLREQKSYLAHFPHGNAYHPNEAAASALSATVSADIRAGKYIQPRGGKPALITAKWFRAKLR